MNFAPKRRRHNSRRSSSVSQIPHGLLIDILRLAAHLPRLGFTDSSFRLQDIGRLDELDTEYEAEMKERMAILWNTATVSLEWLLAVRQLSAENTRLRDDFYPYLHVPSQLMRANPRAAYITRLTVSCSHVTAIHALFLANTLYSSTRLRSLDFFAQTTSSENVENVEPHFDNAFQRLGTYNRLTKISWDCDFLDIVPYLPPFTNLEIIILTSYKPYSYIEQFGIVLHLPKVHTLHIHIKYSWCKGLLHILEFTEMPSLRSFWLFSPADSYLLPSTLKNVAASLIDLKLDVAGNLFGNLSGELLPDFPSLTSVSLHAAVAHERLANSCPSLLQIAILDFTNNRFQNPVSRRTTVLDFLMFCLRLKSVKADAYPLLRFIKCEGLCAHDLALVHWEEAERNMLESIRIILMRLSVQLLDQSDRDILHKIYCMRLRRL